MLREDGSVDSWGAKDNQVVGRGQNQERRGEIRHRKESELNGGGYKDGYDVDPINDLMPVCPNCHAMLHRRTPPFSVEELAASIIAGTNGNPSTPQTVSDVRISFRRSFGRVTPYP